MFAASTTAIESPRRGEVHNMRSELSQYAGTLLVLKAHVRRERSQARAENRWP